MKYLQAFFLFILFVFPFNSIFAQEIQVSAKIQKDTIIIGEQIELLIEAKIPKNSELIFQEYKDTLTEAVEIILNSKPEIVDEKDFKLVTKKLLITSFDTGINVIPSISFKIVQNQDTNVLSSNGLELFVEPYVLIDTIPVDTIYSSKSGFVVFGRNGFKSEIEQNIPDSIKQSLSTDSLQMLKDYIKNELVQIFSSEVTQKTGLYNQEEILKIVESSSQKLYIVDKGGILEDFICAGSVDTVFVKEYQKVEALQALFTLYKIKDIKENIYNTPFNLKEFWYYFKKFIKNYWWLILLSLLVIAGVFYYFFYYKKDKKPIFFKVKPKLPAHIIALAKLEKIRVEKIWNKGQIKEYHVQITDVVREYIENRFGVFAKEMTSSEVLESFINSKLVESDLLEKLRQILELADAVKFAKLQALQNENDLSLKNSFEFVESTKEILEENTPTKQVEPEIELTETLDNNIEKTKDNE
jgi:hypothetical protein